MSCVNRRWCVSIRCTCKNGHLHTNAAYRGEDNPGGCIEPARLHRRPLRHTRDIFNKRNERAVDSQRHAGAAGETTRSEFGRLVLSIFPLYLLISAHSPLHTTSITTKTEPSTPRHHTYTHIAYSTLRTPWPNNYSLLPSRHLPNRKRR